MRDYSNAFTEVYEILNSLEEEEYNKIPSDLINTIEENRNKQYEYVLDDTLSLSEQPMLVETKAILLNIFRDYLATKEQKEKIRKMQAEERRKNEELKRKRYYAQKPEEKKKEVAKETVELIMVPEKESFWCRIKNMLSSIIKK